MMAVFIALPLLTSCVHEWPDETTPAGITLEFAFDTELPPHLTLFYDTKTSSDVLAYDIRYTVEAYRLLPDGTYKKEASARFVYSKDEIQTLDHNVDIALMDGKYKLMVWADYVRQGSLENLYYDNSDFSNITLIGDKHSGGTDYRDAFVGFAEIEARRQSSSAPNPVCRIDMQRPLAKFDIVSTDMMEFVTKQLEIIKSKMEAEGTKSESDTKLPQEINIDDYTVKVHYVGFMPHSFDMWINKPNDAKTVVSFESKIKVIDENKALLGFDYVFVNGKESSVNIIMELFNKDGEKIAGTNSIKVPVIRSKLTTIQGNFLTSKSNSGVGINSGFNGDLIYEWTYANN
jgi:hypothetical protein